MSTTATATSAEKALERMRRYTTISLVGVVGAFTVMGALQVVSLELDPGVSALSLAALLVSGLAAGVLMFSWEQPAPRWVELPLLLLCLASWVAVALVRGQPIVVLVVSLAFGLVAARSRTHRTWLTLVGGVAIVAPLVVAWALQPDANWYSWFVIAAIGYPLSVGLLVLTYYTWGLYLEIDAARSNAAALAVAQERFRFAADLHDIQGHTLHVIRLKTQLARRLLETDAAAAREHLLEAEALIGETLANTRSLAFGDREVALAAELANALELFSAAGIRTEVTGDPSSVISDEFFGLTMRETTTNILRHSQATLVTIEIAPALLTITNDGSPENQRPPSGLARLGERFASSGAAVRTRSSGGRFTTEAVIP
jgi:two-component system sensor histidine kinase DesK